MHFIRSLTVVLKTTHPFHNAQLPSRIVKAILPSLSNLFAKKSFASATEDSGTAKKRGKKGPKGYEGDEVFKVGKDKICTSDEEGEVILGSIAGGFILPLAYLNS